MSEEPGEVPQEEVPQEEYQQEEVPQEESYTEPVQEEAQDGEGLKARLFSAKSLMEVPPESIIEETVESVLPLLGPVYGIAGNILVAVGPLVSLGVEAKSKGEQAFEDYLGKNVVNLALGFVMVLFGRFFGNIKACYEAVAVFGMTDWENLKEIFVDQIQSLYDANEEDNQRDDDGDGVPDVQTLSGEDLFQRKLSLFFQHCRVERIFEGFEELVYLLVLALAALHVHIIRVICLGSIVGDQLAVPIRMRVIPVIQRHAPGESHYWLPFIMLGLCRVVGFVLALLHEQFVGTIFGAIHGGHFLLEAIIDISTHHGVYFLTEGVFPEILVMLIVFIGIYLQLFIMDDIPNFFKLLTLPVYFIETFLQVLISSNHVHPK